MNFKKITAILFILAVLCSNVFAYTSFLPEHFESEQQDKDSVPSSEEQETDTSDNEEASPETVEVTDAEKSDGTDDEKSQEEKDNKDGEESQNNQQDTGSKLPSAPSGGIYHPQNVYSKLFRQIMDVYVQNHLYEFTHEELMYKFFEDFLNDNPMYFKYFTNYLLGTMDPYSSYHEADDGFLDGGSTSKGFGLLVKQDDDKSVVVEKVYKGSNAEKAGILAGDKFVSIMGFKVEDLPLEAVTSIISDINRFVPEDQKALPADEISYSFEFSRNGQIIPVTMTKGVMVTDLIDSYIDDNNGRKTGVITIMAFQGDDTAEKFIEAVNGFYNDKIEHLTIDLRDNPGGNLDYALEMVECFIPKDELICYYNDRSLDEPIGIYSTTDHVTFKSIAILVNAHTASAAELFSNILQTKGIAKLIGTPTYGKGIGQTVYSLVNGDYITITSYQILDQNLESYNEIGLKPDLEIENLERCYILPTLGYFNHENYKQIAQGVYSEPSKALEDRLVIAGFLKEEFCDGIFDDTTKRSLYALQIYLDLEPTGVLDDQTVSRITTLINRYKTYTVIEDSQFEVSRYMHRSFSQGKRRLAEINDEAKEESKKIQARDKALEDALIEQDKLIDCVSDSDSATQESDKDTRKEATIEQENPDNQEKVNEDAISDSTQAEQQAA